MDLFDGYLDDAWPTLAQVLDLPPSLTGVGLDQSVGHIKAAVTGMSESQLTATMNRFCRGWPGEDEHACDCTAIDVEGRGDRADARRVDAHVTAENVAAERFFAWWVREHHGPDDSFNGRPVDEYLERFAAYDRR